MTKLVRVKVIQPFFVSGKRLEIGEIVELQRHDAQSMAALGKIEFL
ncbi:MAG TPA: hypothetical protein VEG37_05105 [Burkholderiales bacterium]|nr:hypothetical protein [Burkholderiales bacterium]